MCSHYLVIFDEVANWSLLQHARIDGIEPLNVAFRTALKTLTSKGHDPLDIRNGAFDGDCDNFDAAVLDIRQRLEDFCTSSFENVQNSGDGLRLLRRFEALAFLGLSTAEHYPTVLRVFMRELDEKGEILLRHIPGTTNPADMMTKYIEPKRLFIEYAAWIYNCTPDLMQHGRMSLTEPT